MYLYKKKKKTKKKKNKKKKTYKQHLFPQNDIYFSYNNVKTGDEIISCFNNCNCITPSICMGKLRFTASDYPFGIYTLFLCNNNEKD